MPASQLLACSVFRGNTRTCMGRQSVHHARLDGFLQRLALHSARSVTPEDTRPHTDKLNAQTACQEVTQWQKSSPLSAPRAWKAHTPPQMLRHTACSAYRDNLPHRKNRACVRHARWDNMPPELAAQPACCVPQAAIRPSNRRHTAHSAPRGTFLCNLQRARVSRVCKDTMPRVTLLRHARRVPSATTPPRWRLPHACSVCQARFHGRWPQYAVSSAFEARFPR